MKTKAICLIGIIILAGLALADGQQGQTIDSLNVRVQRYLLCEHSLEGMAMTADTTFWTTYYRAREIIEIDASDTTVLDTNHFAIDSTIDGVYGIVHDSILIAGYDDGSGHYWIRSININASPPEIVGNYNHVLLDLAYRIKLIDTILIVCTGSEYITFYDASDPTDIDIMSNVFVDFNPRAFIMQDTLLYAVFTSGLYEMGAHCGQRLAVVNLANPSSPISVISPSAGIFPAAPYECGWIGGPLAIVDSFLFIAQNHSPYHAADVINIADPEHPTYHGQFGAGHDVYNWPTYSVATQNNYLYLGYRIYDMSNYPVSYTVAGYRDGCPQGQYVCGPLIYLYQNWSFAVLDFYDYTSALNEQPPARESSEDFFLSPNPVHEYANIRLPNPTDGEIEIYNILGQRVDQKEIIASRLDYSFDLSDYSPGLYLVTVRSGHMRISKKMIVLE